MTASSDLNAAIPTTAGPATDAARPGMRHALAVLYIGLALAALVPGLALRTGYDRGLLTGLASALDDIKFGSGLRFWLGVTGATMLAMLLLYPLRKVLFKSRAPGRISAWFHVHILLGLIGPVLILYHCNFGLGARHANVALWTMLVVAVSGIAGYLVYGRASRDFYTARQQASRHREAIVAALPVRDLHGLRNDALSLDLETFEAALLTPRQGLANGLKQRLKIERDRQNLVPTIAWFVEESARQQGLDAAARQRLGAMVVAHVRAYFGIARSAATQSFREQLWARWRLFHLPVFLVMVLAAGLHIVAVWNMDAPPSVAGQAAAGQSLNVVPPPAAIPTQRVKSQTVTVPARATEGSDTARPLDGKNRAAASPPAMAAVPTPVVRSPVPAPVPANRAIPAPAAPPAVPIAAPVASAPVPVPATPGASDTSKPDIKSVDSELQRKTEAPPMALGGAKPRSLDEQIALLKARQFAHSQAETRFALTGKHLRADCVDCHKVPLRETAQDNPRQCIACHKKDDVHRGRRPDCASCHTTNRWSDRIKK